MAGIIGTAALLASCRLVAGIDQKAPPLHAGTGGVGTGSSGAGGGGACSDDLETDPANCGRCGHDCLGASCSAGRCAPVTVVPDAQGPFDADLSYFYWETKNAIRRQHKDGTGNVTSLPLQGAPIDLIVNKAEVAWTQDDGGGMGEVLTWSTVGGSPNALGATLDQPFWLIPFGAGYAVSGGGTDGSYQYIVEVPIDGGPVVTLRETQGNTYVSALARNDDTLFYADALRNEIGRIVGGEIQVVDVASVRPGALVATLSDLFWADDERVLRKGVTASPEMTADVVGTVGTRITSLAVDEDYVYFAAPRHDQPTGLVGRFARGETNQAEPETLLEAPSAQQVLVDGPWLYVMTNGGIVRVDISH